MLQGKSQSGDVVCVFFVLIFILFSYNAKKLLLNILGVYGFRILTVILIVHYGFPQL